MRCTGAKSEDLGDQVVADAEPGPGRDRPAETAAGEPPQQPTGRRARRCLLLVTGLLQLRRLLVGRRRLLQLVGDEVVQRLQQVAGLVLLVLDPQRAPSGVQHPLAGVGVPVLSGWSAVFAPARSAPRSSAGSRSAAACRTRRSSGHTPCRPPAWIYHCQHAERPRRAGRFTLPLPLPLAHTRPCTRPRGPIPPAPSR